VRRERPYLVHIRDRRLGAQAAPVVPPATQIRPEIIRGQVTTTGGGAMVDAAVVHDPSGGHAALDEQGRARLIEFFSRKGT